MTVQDFFRAHFSLGSDIREIWVQRNEAGHLKRLYSSNHGYDERYMKPEVRTAKIWRWGIDKKCKRIWVTVE